jgi:hypothetical protein
MRDRCQPESNPEQPTISPTILRLFTPAALDFEDFAEAIRLLLGSQDTPQVEGFNEQDNDLLSASNRGTHVVEATEAL